MKKALFLALLLIPATKTPSLKYDKYTNLKIAEPSGICVTADQHYFVASNNGELVEIDKNGRVLRSEVLGMDIEDICSIGTDLYVMDESLRRVYVVDEQTWKQKRMFHINYNGARNKGFESITYIPEKKHFIIITEKDPILLMETDENFNVLNQFQIDKINDMSSATYYNHKLWLLSDEDHTVFKMNPDDYSIEKQFDVPIYNPEGICFDDDGTMRIVSDDMHRLYIFPKSRKIIMKKNSRFTIHDSRFSTCKWFFSLCIMICALCIAPAIVNAQVSLENGDHTFEINGDILAGYNYEFYPAGTTNFHNNTFELDQVRWSFKGRVSNDMEYKLRLDIADLANDIQNPAGGILDFLKDAWVRNKTKYVNITTGYQLVPYSFSSLVDERDDPFLKRALIANRLNTRRDIGVTLSHWFPEERITVYGGIYSGMGETVFSTENPTGKPGYIARVEYSYPARTNYEMIDFHDAPVPVFQCAVNARQTNVGVSTFDSGYLINYNGQKSSYGFDASVMYKGLSLQFEMHQAKIDSAIYSENQQYSYFKEGGYLAQVNYYYRPLKSVLGVRYDELNPNDLIYGNTQRTIAFAYNYMIRQNALCFKVLYEHHLPTPYQDVNWKNDRLIAEVQVIF